MYRFPLWLQLFVATWVFSAVEILADDGSSVPVSVVSCSTTKGDIEMTFYRDWSPNGCDRAVELFQKGFYDNSHLFRIVPNFLCQFGISYTKDENLKALSISSIKDDPVQKTIGFEPGTISFAGSGPNSRTSHLFISFMKSSQFGENPWETPVGIVSKGMDVVEQFYRGYGDMPPWGKGPEQQPIYGGPQYIEENFPLLDKFLACKVKTIAQASNLPPVSGPSESSDTESDEFFNGTDTDSSDDDRDDDGKNEL